MLFTIRLMALISLDFIYFTLNFNERSVIWMTFSFSVMSTYIIGLNFFFLRVGVLSQYGKGTWGGQATIDIDEIITPHAVIHIIDDDACLGYFNLCHIS